MARNGRKAQTRSGERRLIAIARTGDASAFEELITPYERRTYTLLLRMLGSEADAADALQDTFFQAFDKLATFRGDSAFGTWLHRIAVNRALMWLRKKGTDPLWDAEPLPQFNWMDAHAKRVEDWSQSAGDEILRVELRRILDRALGTIPEVDRAIVLLKHAEGLTHEEIAEVTGLSVFVSRSRLHRALLALREKLSGFMQERRGSASAAG